MATAALPLAPIEAPRPARAPLAPVKVPNVARYGTISADVHGTLEVTEWEDGRLWVTRHAYGLGSLVLHLTTAERRALTDFFLGRS